MSIIGLLVRWFWYAIKIAFGIVLGSLTGLLIFALIFRREQLAEALHTAMAWADQVSLGGIAAAILALLVLLLVVRKLLFAR